MKMLDLGRSGLKVTDWCLGTMTWGTHTPEAEAHAQIDRAAEAGINFMDTAEMYPVNPVLEETTGKTEEVIGTWIAKAGARRDDWVIATKVSGAGAPARGGEGYDRDIIPRTVNASLKRLQTDRIDLYQTHGPMRGTYAFRQNWTFDPRKQPSKAEVEDHMNGVLDAMDAVVKAGKVRAWGLSNESAWGTAEFLRLAEARGLPRVASIQNEYSLLCRLFDTDLAELCHHEDVLLMAYSPLAAGILTGKYQGGALPEGSRMAINPSGGGRMTDRVLPVTQVYLDIAARHGLDPVHMALAWLRTRPFKISAIFGATTFAQLEHILAGEAVTLSEAVLEDIEAAHKANPMPY